MRTERLKFHSKIIAGQSPSSDDVGDVEGLPFLQGCAEFGDISPEPNKYCMSPPKRAPEGAWLISVRAPVGELNLADQEYGIGRGLAAIVSKDVEQRFLGYALSHSVPKLSSVSTGSTYEAVSAGQLGDLDIPLPAPKSQKTIADFLDRETARIDQLIEKKQYFLSQLGARIEALVDKALSNPHTRLVRFEHAACRVLRPVVLSEHEELVRLGLYNRGRGLFKKPAADEEGMGDSDFFFVRKGDLILSGQFAWEGAVAMATAMEDGCVVSHRYPVYQGREGVRTAYLLALLRSRYGDFLLNEASRGSAGRNRPLNTWRLGKEKIPIPDDGLQSDIERTIGQERRLRELNEASIERLQEFRSALITAAVTGQIDVATWGKRGNTDRRFDQIEEEMNA